MAKNWFVIFFFLIFLSVYLLGVDTTNSYINSFFFLIRQYQLYLYILGLIPSIFLILYFIISLYILHIYCLKRELGQQIYISKTLPADFVI